MGLNGASHLISFPPLYRDGFATQDIAIFIASMCAGECRECGRECLMTEPGAARGAGWGGGWGGWGGDRCNGLAKSRRFWCPQSHLAPATNLTCKTSFVVRTVTKNIGTYSVRSLE